MKSLRNYAFMMIGALVLAIAAVIIFSPSTHKYPAPTEHRQAISEVMSDYCAVQKALASDDPVGLVAAAEKLEQSSGRLELMSIQNLPASLHSIWEYEVSRLHEDVIPLRGWGEDLKPPRVLFKRVSTRLGILVATMGHAHNVPIYVVRCPMAFDNEGADWLQDSEQIRNPYFGKEMLECGQITKTFPPGR